MFRGWVVRCREGVSVGRSGKLESAVLRMQDRCMCTQCRLRPTRKPQRNGGLERRV